MRFPAMMVSREFPGVGSPGSDCWKEKGRSVTGSVFFVGEGRFCFGCFVSMEVRT
jgi:hypothetical protein